MAIVGLGTDIVEIARLNTKPGIQDKLARRVLTDTEFVRYQAHNNPLQFLAKRFAAKEAAVKALGTGIGNGVSWQHFEVVNDENGAPHLQVSGFAETLFVQRGITSSFISLSDECHYAVATVVLEASN
ncbi:holo-ACP synthase [Alteromonas sp. KUL49]|uniref:holo-ACP synthase n=1 Tax=Alteromonas sp. KUL49 TaxID=2480798 RepID=UPI00102EDE7E|nr:holo-ACP synthase [Alteromonas sp. KUL49]TAP38893.1 holo-ACP synthase [Alteromonas sp. KUL49]GEA12330.1 holo-[acyl-carrier-protein] synthase [Alteromonas sp. KUL49]